MSTMRTDVVNQRVSQSLEFRVLWQCSLHPGFQGGQ